jgi:DNA-binding SARP family transcriptional activator/streptogramin lyase
VQYRILGPLEVVVDGTAMPLGPAKERALLGILLLHANQVVSAERLVDELWGENPPRSAPKVVQVYVSQLRKRFDGSAQIATQPPGYVVTVGADDLDAVRFEQLVAEARALADAGDPAAAVDRFDSALDLWRGPVLADVIFESFAANEAERLEELRVAALADRIDCELARGRHDRVVGELETLVAEHPLRERFRAQLMLALYRAGRQADALAVYQEGRRRLVDELGIEPGPALQQLERSILRQERALEPPAQAPDEQGPRRRRTLTAAVLVCAAVATGAFALVTRAPDRSLMLEPRSVGRIDPTENTMVGELAVGSRPAFIAADKHVLWVVGREGTLSRIDGSRMRVVATRPLDAQPSGLTLGANALWVGDARQNSVVRVDLAHDAVSDRLPLAEPSARAALLGSVAPSLAFGGGSLWVSRGQTNVLRLNPRTHRVLRDIRPSRGAGGAIAFGEDAVWVGGSNAVSRISPALNRVTSTVRLEAMPVALAAGDGSVWVALGTAGKVARVDVETEAVETIAVGGAPTALAVDRDAVWVVVPSEGAVLRIDPDRNAVVARILTGATPTAVAVAGDTVWVAVT